MTNEEALEKMTNLAVTYSQIDANTCELFTIAKKALKKQIREKPNIERQGICSVFRCPDCNKVLINKYNDEFVVGEKEEFCYECGKHMDWRDEK